MQVSLFSSLRLPKPIEEINLPDLQCLVPRVVRALNGGVKPSWGGDRPKFWPEEIPYVSPKQAPHNWSEIWRK